MGHSLGRVADGGGDHRRSTKGEGWGGMRYLRMWESATMPGLAGGKQNYGGGRQKKRTVPT